MKYSTFKKKLKDRKYVENLYIRYSLQKQHLQEHGAYELSVSDYRLILSYAERKIRQLKKILDDIDKED